MKCNKDCFNCIYDDCINDSVDELDEFKEHLYDKSLLENTNKNTRHYKYNHSEKRKQVSKKYLETEKGKETHKRSWQNYAKNHPDRVRAKSRLYYERHKEEIKLRRLNNVRSKQLNDNDGN